MKLVDAAEAARMAAGMTDDERRVSRWSLVRESVCLGDDERGDEEPDEESAPADIGPAPPNGALARAFSRILRNPLPPPGERGAAAAAAAVGLVRRARVLGRASSKHAKAAGAAARKRAQKLASLTSAEGARYATPAGRERARRGQLLLADRKRQRPMHPLEC